MVVCEVREKICEVVLWNLWLLFFISLLYVRSVDKCFGVRVFMVLGCFE